MKGFGVMCTSAITELSTGGLNTRLSVMSSVASVVPQVDHRVREHLECVVHETETPLILRH